jgi:acyl transferase domain-containing protein
MRPCRRSLTFPAPVSGSIKSSIGHLEGGSGLASILKTIMILEKGIIPPNALFEKLNPKIKASFYHLEVTSTLSSSCKARIWSDDF